MRSSQTISLFSERPEVSRKSSSFIVSIGVHAGAAALLFYGLLHEPKLRSRIYDDRLTVRSLELHLPDPVKARADAGSEYPGPSPNAQKAPAGVKSAETEAILRQTENAPKAHQTLLQPKLKALAKLQQDTPLPTVVLWSPEPTPIKSIVPPPPVKVTSAEVHPSPELPNQELKLADVRISATDLSNERIPILPSTTSPVVVKGPELPQAVPTTTSVSTATPTPTALLSISDLRMPEGRVILPPANESSPNSAPGALTQGEAHASARTDSTNPYGSGGTKAAGTGKGDASATAAAANAASKGVVSRIWPNPGAGTGSGAGTSAANGSDAGAGQSEQPTATRITLPRNGVFGSVLVGVSLEDKYPEAARLWGGRLAYTVYLHVGLAKSWILQYSLSSAEEAASAGNINHLDAPWPYNIMRPNISPDDLNADALILHGFVNADGHFEALKVVFPAEFPQSKFVVDSLAQWEFRAARQGGQAKRVEVLLIIPDIE